MKKSDIKVSKQFMLDNWDDMFPDICLSCGKDVLHSELSGGWCAECNGDLANCEECGATINGYFGPLCGVCENDRSFVEDRGPGRAAKTVKVKK